MLYLLFDYLFVYLRVDHLVTGAPEESAVGSWDDMNSPDLLFKHLGNARD